MPIDPVTAHLVFQLVMHVGKAINEVQKLHNNFKIDKQCREIIDKYELLYCESVEEILNNLSLLKPNEKTIFFKCFPNFFEVLEQEKAHWNNRFL